MRKIFSKIHLWLSIPTGIIVSIICLSGAALVFQDEINELTHRDRYFTENVQATPIPLGELIDQVNAKLDDNSVRSVQIPSDPSRNYVMYLKERNRISVFVDPYTGNITDQTQRGEGFFSVMMRLHRWLLDSDRTIGKPVVGYTTLIFVLILVSGMFIWWPKSRKHIKHRFSIKTKFGLKRFWLDLHTSGGMYLFIGLLILALTGLTYSFRWYSKGFYKLLGVEMPVSSGHHNSGQMTQKGLKESKSIPENVVSSHNVDKSEQIRNDSAKSQQEGRPNRMPNRGEASEKSNRHEGKHRGRNTNRQFANDSIASDSIEKEVGEKNITYNNLGGDQNRIQSMNIAHWQHVLMDLKAKNPNFKYISIQDGSANVAQNFTFGNVRSSDKYTFDPASGAITEVQLYKDQPRASKVRGWVYTLHVGAWGGMLSKILTFIVAVVGGTLPMTGYYMFYIKRKRKFKKSK